MACASHASSSDGLLLDDNVSMTTWTRRPCRSAATTSKDYAPSRLKTVVDLLRGTECAINIHERKLRAAKALHQRLIQLDPQTPLHLM